MDLCKVSSRDSSWRLIVYSDFEPGRAIDKLDALLSLDSRDGSIDILGDINIS